MPVLPSGRRIDFSVDRFHALLAQKSLAEAQQIASSLQDANDLLYVMDVVQFHPNTGKPYFSGHLAANFESYADDWSTDDQDALAAWIESETARYYRLEAIDAIRGMVAEVADRQSLTQSLLQAA
jgi:hypothetical protein